MKTRPQFSRLLAAGLVLLVTLLFGSVIFTSYYSPIEIDKRENPFDAKHIPVFIQGHLEFFGPDGFPEKVVFIVDHLMISSGILDKKLQDVTKVCLTYFSFDLQPSSRVYFFSTNYSYSNDSGNMLIYESASCWLVSDLLQSPSSYSGFIQPFIPTRNGEDKLSVSAPLDKEIYFSYPFDYIGLIMECQLRFAYVNDEGQILGAVENSPFIIITDENKTRGFEYSDVGVLNNSATLSDINLNKYSFRLVRTSSIIYLTAVLLAFLFIVPIVLPTVSSFDTALQSIIAYLLGLWGVRQVVLPNQMVSPNLIDLLLMMSYCVAIFSLAITWLQQNQARKKSQLRHNLAANKYYSFANSNVYHNPYCTKLNTHSAQELIEYESEQIAAESGKRCCKLCFNQS